MPWLRRCVLSFVLPALFGACARESGAPVATSAAEPTTSAKAAQAGECAWPRFRGPKGDGVSPDTGLLKEWPADGPKLLWTAKGLGHGYASVTIADGRVYTAGNVDDKTMVTALDASGKILWQTANGPAWKGDYPGTRGTPTLDGDRVYHESPLGEVICLDAKSGEKLWSVNLLKEFDSKNIIWALAESVLIDGDRVICTPGGPKASVVALDKKTGKTAWAAPSGNGDLAGYATATIAESGGLRIVLQMSQKALLGVNADDGQLLFRYEHTTQFDVNATTPIYHEGQIFITSGYGSGSEMLKLTVDGKKASVEKLWDSKELDNQHGGVVLVDGHIYGSAHNRNGGRWICLDWKTGKKMYAERGVTRGALVYADGMLYTLSEKRDMGLVPATPKEHNVVSKFKVPEGGDGPSWAHPVVCGGKLYLRHSDKLFVYDVRAK